ncbi:MAG TPA: pilus assembly protein [Rhizobiaceae bacterium]|nr:pilus assembly protein [Rhizobiaceae bacterium]
MMLDFLRDRRGNYAMMTALALVPIMGGLAIAVDLSEMSRERSMMLNSLDAAGMATARHLVSGASDDALIAYAKNFFESNLGELDASKTNLTVTLPTNQAGGGTLKLCATIDYDPYFVPAFQDLIDAPKTKDIKTADCTEIRLKNTLEVALVLDNSGSMSEEGSGSGKKRITLLKTAAKQLVDTLALQAQMMTQLEKPVQFSLVPFAASVNIAPANDNQPWMDTQGISPIHHESFDWSRMSAANDPNKYAEQVGGVWYKRGTGWGETENLPLTRFSLYQDIVAETDREAIPNTTRRVCTRYRNGRCDRYTNEPEYEYSVSQYTSWQGCVEARPSPYNANDATPIASTPETLFVPMFASDEAGHLWRDLDDDGEPDLNDSSYGYANNWWADWADTGAASRQADMRKYFRVKPYEASSAGSGKGPNYSCTTNAITPLTDVTTEEGLETIKDAIDAMQANGNTNVPEGLAWGWRTVSSGEPFTQGRPDNEKGNDKVVIVLTDGINTYSTAGSDGAGNKSTYAAYGYTGVGYNGTGTTRLFMGTSVGAYNYTTSNYTAALNQHLAKVCDNAKEGKILVMTVSLDLSTSDSEEKKAIEALRKCSSDSRFRKDADGKPSKLFWNATGSNLAEKFKEIADELSNLRIVS